MLVSSETVTIVSLNEYRRLTFGSIKIKHSGRPIANFQQAGPYKAILMEFFYLAIQYGQCYLITMIPLQLNTPYFLLRLSQLNFKV